MLVILGAISLSAVILIVKGRSHRQTPLPLSQASKRRQGSRAAGR